MLKRGWLDMEKPDRWRVAAMRRFFKNLSRVNCLSTLPAAISGAAIAPAVASLTLTAIQPPGNSSCGYFPVSYLSPSPAVRAGRHHLISTEQRTHPFPLYALTTPLEQKKWGNRVWATFLWRPSVGDDRYDLCQRALDVPGLPYTNGILRGHMHSHTRGGFIHVSGRSATARDGNDLRLAPVIRTTGYMPFSTRRQCKGKWEFSGKFAEVYAPVIGKERHNLFRHGQRGVFTCG
jgi:hypothetical protein